jgi:hypothetical protein
MTVVLRFKTLRYSQALLQSTFLIALLTALSACGQKDIPFTDYLIENLLKDNLSQMARPAIFEVTNIAIKSSEHEGDRGTAQVDVELLFPEDFDTVVGLHKLEPFNVKYLQFKSSFGKFAAGEKQIHHAQYDFIRRKGKWTIIGSKALAAPDIKKPE